ncbi:beta-ketoacyl synthase N-terminal-like domain-containing protein [Micromonospora sp. DT233]|uniref:beta-ketoacyl synthase N-terminal-like domain-containing protein n=1 Tax=Micromonospora sp. DT233 TaxID=3393432 RepID=UPI003CF23BE5
MSTGPAAVTGMGVRCAIGTGVAAFTAALRRGTCGITEVRDPATLGPAYAALLGEVDFAEALAGVPAPVARRAGRAAARAPLGLRAAVAVAVQACHDADLLGGALARDRIGVVVAGHNLTGQYAQQVGQTLARAPARVPGRAALRLLDSDHLGVLSHVLDAAGEGCQIGGASASGNIGIVTGARLVAAGVVDACVVVGALADLTPLEMQALFNLGAMADQPCRPFDAGHRGFVPGQASAALVLEHPDSARSRRATVYAEIVGAGICLDANSGANPDEHGEVRAMAAALAAAGRPPGDVGYVNAHGTGSPLGDRTEAAALLRIFGSGADRPWVNATKALTGHCLYAAGVLEAIATIVQLRGGFLHPDPRLVESIEPRLRLVGREPIPARVGLALSNGFGFGGINTSVAIAVDGNSP